MKSAATVNPADSAAAHGDDRAAPAGFLPVAAPNGSATAVGEVVPTDAGPGEPSGSASTTIPTALPAISTAATGPVIRRFGVGLEFREDPDIADAHIESLTFDGRPGSYSVGGTQGSRQHTRHLVSWDLESRYWESTVAGKKVGNVAGDLGVDPRKKAVEGALRDQIANDSPSRLTHQGSAAGNDRLSQVAQFGKALIGRGTQAGDATQQFQGHVYSLLGSVDLPSPETVAPGINPAHVMQHTIDRASKMYATVQGMPPAAHPVLAAALGQKLALHGLTGDAVGKDLEPEVMAQRAGGPASAAAAFTHFAPGEFAQETGIPAPPAIASQQSMQFDYRPGHLAGPMAPQHYLGPPGSHPALPAPAGPGAVVPFGQERWPHH